MAMMSKPLAFLQLLLRGAGRRDVAPYHVHHRRRPVQLDGREQNFYPDNFAREPLPLGLDTVRTRAQRLGNAIQH